MTFFTGLLAFIFVFALGCLLGNFIKSEFPSQTSSKWCGSLIIVGLIALVLLALKGLGVPLP